MFDENLQNNTQTTDQNGQTDDLTNNHISSTVTDIPADFPMVSPAQDQVSAEPNTPTIQSTHPTYTPSDSTPVTDQSNDQDLMSIKKSALQQLSPLVDQLDQTPDEKFKTMLMMIQASDDKSMISSAYQIAQKITDEKAKAQALLDIVNEINYFTQSVETE
ncbi:MAG TPA: hypothetical protein VMQ58_00240 [Candidatus Saccharimonadales bacterium]|jgi:hypothetical protein|nr:hypothetical protein [Candidatus Saccharimonadales bacterium]